MTSSAAEKLSFRELVTQNRRVRSRIGYEFDPADDVWKLYPQSIDFTTLAEMTTPDFRDEVKGAFERILASQKISESYVGSMFTALLDCLHAHLRSTGQPASKLTDPMIEAWRMNASSKHYTQTLKGLIKYARKQDRTAFAEVTEKTLKRLTSPDSDVEYVLALDPKRGPWLQGEVALQDVAVESAYASGEWHPEKYLMVQLLRTFGMRIESLAFMKVGDVRALFLGHRTAQVRWPFRKNDLPVEQAMWHPLSSGLARAMEEYLELRLDGLPRDEWESLPLFTPEGQPGAFLRPTNPNMRAQGIEAGQFQGHCRAETLSGRFTAAMNSLRLTTSRTGTEEPMYFFPHRERHTVGMRLALKGFSARHIALFLGHSSEKSGRAYVDLAVMCFQMRNPKFFHLMDSVGAIYSNETLSKEEINSSYDLVISKEASVKTGGLSVVGGGSCEGCHFAGASSDVEPWPCLSCPKFHLYEDADLQPIWDILQERKALLENPDGGWNSRFDPAILKTLQRYEALLIAAETHRRDSLEARGRIEERVQ